MPKQNSLKPIWKNATKNHWSTKTLRPLFRELGS